MFIELYTVIPNQSSDILIIFCVERLSNSIEGWMRNEICIESVWFVWNICIINSLKIDLWLGLFQKTIFMFWYETWEVLAASTRRFFTSLVLCKVQLEKVRPANRISNSCKAVCVNKYIQTESITTTTRRYTKTYGEAAPSANSIKKWHGRSQENGRLKDLPKSGRSKLCR